MENSKFTFSDCCCMEFSVNSLSSSLNTYKLYILIFKEIVKCGQTEEMLALAKEKGAKGIRFYGICCSGLSAMYRYDGVIPLSNAVSAELVLMTGALDLWVADVQDVFPAIMDVAKCYRTTVVTTSASARLPGAERMEFDRHHSNIADARALAEKIVRRGIESFEDRKGIPVYIPPYEVTAEVGFSVEYLNRRFGSFRPIAEAIRDGRILGIVNMVGCNNPKVPYERCIADVAKVLIQNNVIILSNGCASYPLMKLGYCAKDANQLAGDSLREFLEPDLPPVWHVGECIDNTRSSGIMVGIAAALGQKLPDMPYAFTMTETAKPSFFRRNKPLQTGAQDRSPASQTRTLSLFIMIPLIWFGSGRIRFICCVKIRPFCVIWSCHNPGIFYSEGKLIS